MKQNNLVIRTREALKEKNIFKVISDGIKLFFEYSYYKIFKSSGEFSFRGERFRYFYYPYNATWRNERAIEIPIVWNFVKKYKGKNILELGNVLSHYFSIEHDILDKYEKAKGVINQDMIDFNPDKKYDLIVTISTLEHVGWDEAPKEPEKVLKVIENLKKCLDDNGKIIFTIPLGLNPHLDEMIKKDRIKLDEQYFLKRISKDNTWTEINLNNIKNAKYNEPFPGANIIMIGVIKK